MGVPGLLKALTDVQREVHVSEFRGRCIGLDAHCFLHRGKYACAKAVLSGQASTAFLRPLLDVVETLRSNGVEPFAVFDGGPLPLKEDTEQARHRARENAKWKAGAFIRSGGGACSVQAAKHLSCAVEVTPEIVAQAVSQLQRLGVSYVVAPCEADAQLAHLALTGRVEACATEDSDLLSFGCQRVIFGLDARGHGREIKLAEIGRSRGLSPYRFVPEALPDLSVLSGCDYLPSIPRMGLKTAAQLLHRSRGDVQRALLLARREGFQVPAGYLESFSRARLAYISQTVFSIKERCMRPLRPLPAGVRVEPGCLGPLHSMPDAVARGVAEGRLHPVTLEPFEGQVLTGQADLAIVQRAIDGTACIPLGDSPTQEQSPCCSSVEELGSSTTTQNSGVTQDFKPPRRTTSTQSTSQGQSAERQQEQTESGEASVDDLSQPLKHMDQEAPEQPMQLCVAEDLKEVQTEEGDSLDSITSLPEGRSPARPFRMPRTSMEAEAPVQPPPKRRRLGCRLAC